MIIVTLFLFVLLDGCEKKADKNISKDSVSKNSNAPFSKKTDTNNKKFAHDNLNKNKAKTTLGDKNEKELPKRENFSEIDSNDTFNNPAASNTQSKPVILLDEEIVKKIYDSYKNSTQVYDYRVEIPYEKIKEICNYSDDMIKFVMNVDKEKLIFLYVFFYIIKENGNYFSKMNYDELSSIFKIYDELISISEKMMGLNPNSLVFFNNLLNSIFENEECRKFLKKDGEKFWKYMYNQKILNYFDFKTKVKTENFIFLCHAMNSGLEYINRREEIKAIVVNSNEFLNFIKDKPLLCKILNNLDHETINYILINFASFRERINGIYTEESFNNAINRMKADLNSLD